MQWGGDCIARSSWIVLQHREKSVLQYSRLYCKIVQWLAWEEGVSQYSWMAWQLYCNKEGRLEKKNGIAIQKLYCDSRGSGLLDCVATQGRDTASQTTTQQRAQVGAQAEGEGAREERHGVRGRAGRTRQGSGRCTAGAQQAWGLGAGRAGWPRVVHLVHSACFWPGLTQYCS